MRFRRSFLKSVTALVAAGWIFPTAAAADEPLPVVATFSILGDMTQRIGGEHIALTTLVEADGDTHVYQPTPQDAAAVASAKVMFVNGLEFEGWLERLAEAAPFEGEMVITTAGIDAIKFDGHHSDDHGDHDDVDHAVENDHDHDHKEHADDKGHDHGQHEHGEEHAGHDHDDHAEQQAGHDDHGDHHGHDHGAFDPHAWQTIENAMVYVDNIAAGLAKADPENAADYYTNRAEYVAELERLEAEIDALMASIPQDKRTVVTAHDAFGYLGAHYSMTFLAPQGLSTESEASAADVAALIEQIRDEDISAVFIETLTDNRLIEQIANETGASIGGTLYTGALSGPDGPAPTFIDMLRHNAIQLSQALGS